MTGIDTSPKRLRELADDLDRFASGMDSAEALRALAAEKEAQLPEDTVPWPIVTGYSGGAAHEGIGGRVLVRLKDDGPDVEYMPVVPAVKKVARRANTANPAPRHNMNPLLTPRDWQAQALREASGLIGTPEGSAKLVEAKRYGALAYEIERLRLLTFCGCGDQFSLHDPATCGACVAGMTCKPAPVLLTNEEIETVNVMCSVRTRYYGGVEFARAIEAAALKKNGIGLVLHNNQQTKGT